MYVIQSGLVEIVQYFDKEHSQEFVIERLYRGSVINPYSFLMNDGIDTDAKCKSPVGVYYIHLETVKRMRQKHYELDKALERKEVQLVNPQAKEPALDYIIQDPYSHQHFLQHKKTSKRVHNHVAEEYRRRLTVKLKNAIMVHWLEVKKKRNKPSFEEIIKSIQKKKNDEKNNKEAFKEERKRLHKEKKDRLKKEAQQRKEEAEAHLTSYINKE
jgi:CRP-like cAMP-binding protein